MSNIISTNIRKLANLAGYDFIKLKKQHSRIETHLPNIIERYGINCVIDVGANRGQFASRIRSGGYKGHIVSFEPLKKAFEELQKACSTDNKWQAHNFALGSENGTFDLNVSACDVFSSFLGESKAGSKIFNEKLGVDRVEQIEVKRLDTIYDEVVPRESKGKALLKMDTQGFDREVFLGAEGCLPSIVSLLSEVSVIPIYENCPDYIELLSIYRKAGFELSGAYPVTREPDSLILIELDVVMVKKQA